jgi:hypothetical protein
VDALRVYPSYATNRTEFVWLRDRGALAPADLTTSGYTAAAAGTVNFILRVVGGDFDDEKEEAVDKDFPFSITFVDELCDECEKYPCDCCCEKYPECACDEECPICEKPEAECKCQGWHDNFFYRDGERFFGYNNDGWVWYMDGAYLAVYYVDKETGRVGTRDLDLFPYGETLWFAEGTSLNFGKDEYDGRARHMFFNTNGRLQTTVDVIDGYLYINHVRISDRDLLHDDLWLVVNGTTLMAVDEDGKVLVGLQELEFIKAWQAPHVAAGGTVPTHFWFNNPDYGLDPLQAVGVMTSSWAE